MLDKRMENRLTLSVNETATMLGISRNLAYSLAKRNSLPVPVIKLGKRLVISRRAVLNLLQDDSQTTKTR